MVFVDKYAYLKDEALLNKEIEQHKLRQSISEIKPVEKGEIDLYFNRAANELKLAKTALKISDDDSLKLSLELVPDDTFYSGVIGHSYYSMFYGTKAILLTLNIKTNPPNIHKATLDAFAHYLVINKKLDFQLLQIYKKSIVQADSLLGLFIEEKDKRSEFTYKTLPQANKEPAQESIDNANKFLTHIKKVIESNRKSLKR